MKLCGVAVYWTKGNIERAAAGGSSARKYLITKAPSRAASGPSHLRQVTSRCFTPGAASTRTTLYFASQCGQCIGAGGRDFMVAKYG